MSDGQFRPWTEAAEIAKRLSGELSAVALRAKTAGSVRRQKAQVRDIEIVAEARIVEGGLFAEPVPDVLSIRAVVETWGPVTKGGERFLQVQLPGGPRVDVFVVAPPAQWGSILAIRTGPAELGQLAVTRLKMYGLRHEGGRVLDSRGNVVPTPSEEVFFALAGLPCLQPRLRDYEAARVPLSPNQRETTLQALAGRPRCPICGGELTNAEVVGGGVGPCATCLLGARRRGGVKYAARNTAGGE